MVETAIVSTMTMPVAADRPPMKASIASAVCPPESGKERMKFSGFICPGPKCSRPPMASGKTKRLISSMYSGNTHSARGRCRSRTFSTTMTWNCRGSSSTESMDSKVSANHCAQTPLPPLSMVSSLRASGSSRARANRSPRPSNRPQTTNTPTAMKATSLTTDSKATAATMPSWRSVLSRWRAPKTMVKPASSKAV